jgi:hypothetical protein
MVRRWFCIAVALAAAWAAWGLTCHEAQAQIRRSSPSDLFYNYYAPPGSPAGVGAALYPSPRPTPPLVGQTYITYQPLMPHEYLYEHTRVYWSKQPCSALTRTKVEWRCGGFLSNIFCPSVNWSGPSLGYHVPQCNLN